MWFYRSCLWTTEFFNTHFSVKLYGGRVRCHFSWRIVCNRTNCGNRYVCEIRMVLFYFLQDGIKFFFAHLVRSNDSCQERLTRSARTYYLRPLLGYYLTDGKTAQISILLYVYIFYTFIWVHVAAFEPQPVSNSGLHLFLVGTLFFFFFAALHNVLLQFVVWIRKN